jgi:hypothetical protein
MGHNWKTKCSERSTSEAKQVHQAAQRAVEEGSHGFASGSLLALAIAECENRQVKVREQQTTNAFEAAVRRLQQAQDLLKGAEGGGGKHRDRQRVKRAKFNIDDEMLTTTGDDNDACDHLLCTASELLMLDSVLPNSAITSAVEQLRHGRYHPLVYLYNTDGDLEWNSCADMICTYLPDVVAKEYLDVGTRFHFTFVHIVSRMRLVFADLRRVLLFLDSTFRKLVNNNMLLPVAALTEEVPLWPNGEWGNLWAHFLESHHRLFSLPAF